MPPKPGANAKKEGGRAKKAENDARKQEAEVAAKEKVVAADWDTGAKKPSKAQQDKEAKKAADAARKAENARLLAEEEAQVAAKKAAPKAAKKKATPKPAGPGALAAGGGLEAAEEPPQASSSSTAIPDLAPPEPVESFAATGIDDALDMLSLVNAKSDKASVGQQAAKLEAHPERRFKAAFEAYLERELPEARKDRPGLRLQQYRDMLFKQFQKHPDNPFNQTLVSYDATKDDKVAALAAERDKTAQRLRDKDSAA